MTIPGFSQITLTLLGALGISLVALLFTLSAGETIQVYVDETTGCEYLVTSSGALFPRLNNAGKHFCEPPAQFQ